MEEIKLDSYDKRILYELDKNARATTTNISQKIRKSKQFVDYRIKKLEEQKVLLGYTTVIDYSKLGQLGLRIYFKFHNITPEEQKQLENELIKDKEVWWLVTLEGIWDVGYAVGVQDINHFYAYWDKIMIKYRKYIKDRAAVRYTHIKQYPKAYLIGKDNDEKGTLVGAGDPKRDVDKMELELLHIIADKARMSLLEISQKLKTSPHVVKNRMKWLEKEGVIQGYRALIDVSSLGYRYYKAYINFVNTDKFKELEEFCLRHPNILNTNRTIGGKDFEVELQAKSFDEFESIMNQLRSTFPGMIDDYEFVIAREEKKMNYFPFE